MTDAELAAAYPRAHAWIQKLLTEGEGMHVVEGQLRYERVHDPKNPGQFIERRFSEDGALLSGPLPTVDDLKRDMMLQAIGHQASYSDDVIRAVLTAANPPCSEEEIKKVLSVQRRTPRVP
jgi:hypothetical protein